MADAIRRPDSVSTHAAGTYWCHHGSRDALIAASVPREDFGRAFGFHRMGDTLGAVIGPLIALAGLALLDGNVRAVMWWAVVPAVASTLLTFLVVEHRRVPDGPPAVTEDPPGQKTVVPKSPLPPAFWRVTVVLVAIAVVNFPDVLLLLRISDLGFTTTQVVLAYVLYNLVYTLGSYPAGALSDRLPRPLVYGVGLLAFAAAYAGLAVVGHNAWAFDLDRKGTRVGVEMAGTSVTSPGAEGSIRWMKPDEIARATVARNPQLKWCDMSQRGYMAVELTPAAATSEFRFLATVRQRSTALAGTKRMTVLAGQRKFSA